MADGVINQKTNQLQPVKDPTSHRSDRIHKLRRTLKGSVDHSFNAGIIKPISYKKVFAGEHIYNYTLKGVLRMQTPRVPSLTKLVANFKAFFVPHKLVYADYEKWAAARRSLDPPVNFPSVRPDIRYFPQNNTPGQYVYRVITDSLNWRNSPMSTYLPRFFSGMTSSSEGFQPYLQNINPLALRGYRYIYNDFYRPKGYVAPVTTYNDSIVGLPEQQSYFGGVLAADGQPMLHPLFRGMPRNSYYTDFRATQIADSQLMLSSVDRVTHVQWQQQIAEYRERSQNANMTDHQVVAELRGSKPAQEGKVRYLGEANIPVNFQQIAATAQSDINGLSDQFQGLGVVGAFSYTEFSTDIFSYESFNEDGYVHVLCQISADHVYQNGLAREHAIGVSVQDYRPELSTLVDDQLYSYELGTAQAGQGSAITPTDLIGYKRRYSELLRLPDSHSGDLTSGGYLDVGRRDAQGNSTPIASQDYWTYTRPILYENIYVTTPASKGAFITTMKPWLDYSDLLLNRNQTVPNYISSISQSFDPLDIDARLSGEAQFQFFADCECDTQMPVNPDISGNYLEAGQE